jgi:hypothetical protein
VSDAAGDIVSKQACVKTYAFGKSFDTFVDGGVKSTAAAWAGQKTPREIEWKEEVSLPRGVHLNASKQHFLVDRRR